MKIADIDKIKDLLHDLQINKEKHDSLASAAYIHIEFTKAGGGRATHVHFDEVETKDGFSEANPDFTIIHRAVMHALEEKTARLKRELELLGVTVDG